MQSKYQAGDLVSKLGYERTSGRKNDERRRDLQRSYLSRTEWNMTAHGTTMGVQYGVL